jgi:hypothetical protein
MLRSRRLQAVIAFALLATPLFVFGQRVFAIQDSEDKVWFGPVGLGVGQGARISVYTVGNPNELPWEFAVRVFNRRGEVVQERTFQVAAGAIASLEIDPAAFPVDRLGRRTLRAEIVGFNPQPDPPGKYAVTFEVYSQVTGHTSILLGGPDTLPAAQIVTPPGSND